MNNRSDTEVKMTKAEDVFYKTVEPWQTEAIDNFEPEMKANILKAMRAYAKIACDVQRAMCAVTVPDNQFDSRGLKNKIRRTKQPDLI